MRSRKEANDETENIYTRLDCTRSHLRSLHAGRGRVLHTSAHRLVSHDVSGYVDTSAQWNLGTATATTRLTLWRIEQGDGFNLDVVQISIAKPLYDVNGRLGTKRLVVGGRQFAGLGFKWYQRDFAIRQAYVALRAPIGNGLDFKVGAFDTIIGYESVEAGNNPNYTHSYGFNIEPTTHTGVLAAYRFCDCLSASAGIADTVGPMINSRAFYQKAESYKTYMGSVALTAPESWGSFAGSTLYAGAVNGYSGAGGNGNQINWYAGATVATPVTGLKLGVAYDYLNLYRTAAGDAWAASLYASYQATEKLSFHARGELYEQSIVGAKDNKVYALTGTVQYDLWKNVISRLEVRWDHGNQDMFGGSDAPSADAGPDTKNAVLIAANLIYKF